MKETTKKILALALAAGLGFSSIPANAQAETQKEGVGVVAEENSAENSAPAPADNAQKDTSDVEVFINETENKDIVISLSDVANVKARGIRVTFLPNNSTVAITVKASKDPSISLEWKLDPTTVKNEYVHLNPDTGTITINDKDIASESKINVYLSFVTFPNGQSKPEVIENLIASHTARKKLSYTISKTPLLAEGTEVNPVQIIIANSNTAKIISEPKNGIQIDESGYLRGTPTGLEYRQADDSVSVSLSFSLIDGSEKNNGSQVQINIKKAPLKVEIKDPVIITESEETNQQNIVTVSRADSTITSNEVNGLRIDENGSLIGTATGIQWAEGETEKEIPLHVTIRHPWHTESIEKEIKVKVQKKITAPQVPSPEQPAPKQPEPQNPAPESPSNPAPQAPAPQNPAPSAPQSPAPQAPSVGAPSAPKANQTKPEAKKPEKKAEEKKQDAKAENKQNETPTRHSYISGYTDGSVRPNAEVSRAEVTAMIAKFMGYDVSDESKPAFNDVEDAWYNKFINAVVKSGITKGYTDGSFKPNHSITRAEFIHLVVQLYQGEYNAVLANFSDVQDNYWAKDSITKAFAAGLIKGYEDGSFRPEQTLSRAEAVVILNRLSKQTLDKESLDKLALSKQFIDLDKSHWAYYEILEASK